MVLQQDDGCHVEGWRRGWAGGGGGERLCREASRRQLAQRVEASLVCLPQSLRTLKTSPDSHMLTSLPLTHCWVRKRAGVGRGVVHSKKGHFCVRSAVGRHLHFNALLYTCQRESMSSAGLPWMPAKPNRNPFNFQIVECLHTHNHIKTHPETQIPTHTLKGMSYCGFIFLFLYLCA